MGQIVDSPLVEAIFELRWGHSEKDGVFKYSRDESDFFPGVFFQSVKAKGFLVSDPIASVPMLPFQAKHRFRKEPNKWPCIQVGMGLFTVNQIGNVSKNEGEEDEYDWDTFKPVIIDGLNAFAESHPAGIEGLESPKAILRYQDGFALGGETIESFVSDKIEANIKISDLFTNEQHISKNASEINLKFNYQTSRPNGIIAVAVTSVQINGEPGILIETTVLSDLKNQKISVDFLSNWCEEAHDLQRHAYETLISKTVEAKD